MSTCLPQFHLLINRAGVVERGEGDSGKLCRGGSSGHAPTQRFREGFLFLHAPREGRAQSVAGADRAQRFDARRQRFEHSFRTTTRWPCARPATWRITHSGPIACITSTASRHWPRVISARLSRRSASCWLGIITVGLASRACCSASPSVSSSVFHAAAPCGHFNDFATKKCGGYASGWMLPQNQQPLRFWEGAPPPLLLDFLEFTGFEGLRAAFVPASR